MKHLPATILITILTVTALPVFSADKTEDKIENSMEQRIEKLNVALERFQEFKKAYAKAPSKEREATLRILCRRMQRETKAINNAIATMDLYLDIKSCCKGVEPSETKTVKSDLAELKRDLKHNTVAQN